MLAPRPPASSVLSLGFLLPPLSLVSAYIRPSAASRPANIRPSAGHWGAICPGVIRFHHRAQSSHLARAAEAGGVSTIGNRGTHVRGLCGPALMAFAEPARAAAVRAASALTCVAAAAARAATCLACAVAAAAGAVVAAVRAASFLGRRCSGRGGRGAGHVVIGLRHSCRASSVARGRRRLRCSACRNEREAGWTLPSADW
jgi:hypothetical protein